MQVISADREEMIADIIKAGPALEIIGHGSKLTLGRPVGVTHRLSVATLSGVTLYEPDELVLSAKAGTPLAEIESLLTSRGQALAFEPPDLSRLLGAAQRDQTLGGVVATNLSGPRRCVAGGVRDHLLGLRAVNGRGEIFRAGGRVVKNVTGYDLCKLLTGSFGTMAVFTELTMKVLPAPETEQSLLIRGLDAERAVALMCQAMGSSAGISGAAWCPEQGLVTGLRLEGFAASVAARRQRLEVLVAGKGEISLLEDQDSRRWWQDIRDVLPLVGRPEQAIWKISLAATQAPPLVKKLQRIDGSQLFLDWGGALLWLALPCGEDAQAPLVRGLLPEDAYAFLLRAPEAVRARQAVFQPRPAAQRAIEERVRQSFDPERKLNPGRMSAALETS